MRKPSDATKLRAALRDLKDARGALELARIKLEEYRIRSTKAEQEVAEWKRRFDELLRRTPEEK